MSGFEWGKVFGVLDLEDGISENVFRIDPKKLVKTKVKGKLHLGRIIEFDRDCSKCAKHVKLQIGSDVVFLDGKPNLLDTPVKISNGVIVVPMIF
jgi:hypothetical protein